MVVDGYDEPITLCGGAHHLGRRHPRRLHRHLAQSLKGINVPLSYATAYSMFGLACAVAGEMPNNSGSLSAFSVSAPDGCILNARTPAPVSARHVIGQMLPDVVFGCLRQVDARPRARRRRVLRVAADTARRDARCGPRALRLHAGLHQQRRHRRRHGKDGLSATAFPTNLNGTPVEVAETHTPADLLAQGAARWVGRRGPHARRAGPGDRGGLILRQAVRDPGVLRPRDHPPRGRDGGLTARPVSSAWRPGADAAARAYRR